MPVSTLEEVLKLASSELHVLDQPCRDEHLCELALSITNWPILATFMGISEPEIEEIVERWPRRVAMQRIYFLRKWKDKLGQNGTYRVLCEAFCRIGVTSYVTKLYGILCNSRSSCLDTSASNMMSVSLPSDTRTSPLAPVLNSIELTPPHPLVSTDQQEYGRGAYKNSVLHFLSRVSEQQTTTVCEMDQHPLAEVSLPAYEPTQTNKPTQFPLAHQKDCSRLTVGALEYPRIIPQHASHTAISQGPCFEPTLVAEASVTTVVHPNSSAYCLDQVAGQFSSSKGVAPDNYSSPRRSKHVSALPGPACGDMQLGRHCTKKLLSSNTRSSIEQNATAYSARSQKWDFQPADHPFHTTSSPCTYDDQLNQGISLSPADERPVDNPPPPNTADYLPASPGLVSAIGESKRYQGKNPVIRSHMPTHEHQLQLKASPLPMVQQQPTASTDTFLPTSVPRQKSRRLSVSTPLVSVAGCGPGNTGLAKPFSSLQSHDPLQQHSYQPNQGSGTVTRQFDAHPRLICASNYMHQVGMHRSYHSSSGLGGERVLCPQQIRPIPRWISNSPLGTRVHGTGASPYPYSRHHRHVKTVHPHNPSKDYGAGTATPPQALDYSYRPTFIGRTNRSVSLPFEQPGLSQGHLCYPPSPVDPFPNSVCGDIHNGCESSNYSPNLKFGPMDRLAEFIRKQAMCMIRLPGFADDKLERLTLMGGVGVVEKRKSIEVADIFSLDQQRRKVVLIEGCPGAGKTSLARHIYKKWAKQESFQEFKVVILVDLGKENVQSIPELLPKDEVTHLEACRGKGVLFVLDGWDKFVCRNSDPSVLEKLICKPEVLQLDLSTLLITSRPNASFELKNCASSWIRVTDPLDSFAEYMRQTYLSQTPGFVTLQWPPPPTRKVFNLAMIQTETIRRSPPNDELVRMMMRGAVPEIVRRNVSILLENLFKFSNHDYLNRKVVLVEGAPGSGKSTLAWHIVQMWNSGEMFPEFKIIFFVQLRDPEIQASTSLTDLFPAEMSQKAVDDIKARFGEGVLFVLDGWDEYKPGLSRDTLIRTLICEPHVLQLSSSTLLITSRPIASAQVQEYAANRVEIVGFTQSELRKYFQEALGDSDSEATFFQQVQDHPVIEASCYLPLNAAIVAHLFKELNQVLPTTLHGIFSALVCGCLARHLRKESETKELTSISCFEEIPLMIEQPFKNVCTLAYEGVKVDKVTFTAKNLTAYNLPVDIEVLSLMQGVESFASKKSKLYHFLHLSVQELLAAFHISSLFSSEQVQVFKNMFDQPRFAAVFRFYAAFTKLQTEGVKDIVASIVQSGNEDRILNLLHCLYEAQDSSLCAFVASQLNVGLDLSEHTLSPLDCLTIGYFLSCVCQARKREFKVDLTECSLTDYSLGFLVKELSKGAQSSDGTGLGCLVLNLRKNSLHGSGVRCLSKLINHCCVFVTLDLSENKIQEDEDGLKNLLEGLRSNTSIETLELEDCSLRITNSNGPLLVNMLRENITLKTLDLSENSIQDNQDGLKYLLEGLRTNTSIETLVLVNCSLRITDSNGLLLVNMLKENTTIETLDLSWNNIQVYGDGLKYLLEGLKTNTSLLMVTLEHCSSTFTEDTGQMIVDLLETNRTLQVLCLNSATDDIDHIEPAVENKVSSADGKGLLKLYLIECGLTDTLTQSIAVAIRKHSFLEVLNLYCNENLSDAGVAAIAEVLRHSHSLQELRIRQCGVTDQGMESIAAALEVNSSLAKLYLGSCEITDRGLLTLGGSLKKNGALKMLEFCTYYDFLTEEGRTQFNDDIKSLNKARKQQGLALLELPIDWIR